MQKAATLANQLPIGHGFSKMVRLGAILVGITLFVALILYGVSVVIETHVLSMGRKARIVEEDNQFLQVKLDKLRAYQNVADASADMQGLKTPVATVEVAERPAAPTTVMTMPESLPPRDVYGY